MKKETMVPDKPIRSRFFKFILLSKLGYFQWLCWIAAFSFVLGVFQFYLPASVVGKPANDSGSVSLKDILGELDIGEDLRFQPKSVLARFQKEERELNSSYGSKREVRLGYRKPFLALVFADLSFDSYQIVMATVATALQDIGYAIEVISAEDGPAHAVWRYMRVPVTVLQTKDGEIIGVDWLKYDGILANSLEAKGIISSLMLEPFKSLPLIWAVHEKTLATRINHYATSGKADILSDWRKSFSRATVVVFPNYVLPIMYSTIDAGNYFVIPGAPAEACELGHLYKPNEAQLKAEMDISLNDFVIAIVGSQFMYKGLWLENSLILQALKPLLAQFPSNKDANSRLKVFIVTGDATNKYKLAVEAISAGLRYPENTVKHVAGDAHADLVLRAASLVIYGSFLEEELFPEILTKALCFGKLIIAPHLSIIEKYVDDKVNGYLFPKENIQKLSDIVSQVVARGKLTPLAHNVASLGRETAKSLMVSEAVKGYASLLRSMLKVSSKAAPAKDFSEIYAKTRNEWKWDIFKTIHGATYKNRALSSSVYLEKIEQHNAIEAEITTGEDGYFAYRIWEEEKQTVMAYAAKRREEEELKDRSDQNRGTWEDVYRSAKRADRLKKELHERDDGEIERTGQPLCIYEPYFGEGTWPFLHHNSLYRGISLSTRGRRPASDDIDASSRLPILSNAYYRDVLGDIGAIFSVAHKIDRIHKNAWIGFQSWRLSARKASLSKFAEMALLNATQTRKNGDMVYFWSRMDLDNRNPRKLDFWSFCDSINAGNCRSIFSNTLKRMYGVSHDWDSVLPMPSNGDAWSVMQSWVLPTRSFLEFVMFARMFVDQMDAQMYDEHHESGFCSLTQARDKHCYSRVFELLINVWAYHSGRRMVYINPESGIMQEQHKLKNRRGKMWVKWFSFDTLKSMDEDLAEEADSDMSKRRWLWPSTGEVFWQGMYEKQRTLRQKEKEKKKQQSRDKLQRMKKKNHQKILGKFVKPTPEETSTGNSTVTVKTR